jgi:hypothetical protein
VYDDIAAGKVGSSQNTLAPRCAIVAKLPVTQLPQMPKKIAAAVRVPVPIELGEPKIHLIRGQKVMLDSDLAELYQVPTKALNQAVHRNLDRFPADFMLQLTDTEANSLRSQSVTSNNSRGGWRYLPYAFTEHGVAMLSS